MRRRPHLRDRLDDDAPAPPALLCLVVEEAGAEAAARAATAASSSSYTIFHTVTCSRLPPLVGDNPEPDADNEDDEPSEVALEATTLPSASSCSQHITRM